MNNCSRCQSELCFDHVPQNRAYRCSACGQINIDPASADSSLGSKASRRSFQLGLAVIAIAVGIVALLVTDHPWIAGLSGIPAVLLGLLAFFFGVKAILRSRYQPISSRSKWAAVIGALSGMSLGVLMGGLVCVVLLASLFVLWSTSESIVPAEVERVLSSTASIDLPKSADWHFSVSHQSPVKNRIEIWDDEEFVPSQQRFYLSWMNALYTSQWGSKTQNRNNMRKDSLELIMGQDRDKVQKVQDSTEMLWRICGQERAISKTEWNGTDEQDGVKVDLGFRTYQCLFDANEKTFCLTFASELPNTKITETEIQHLFESFVPKK